MHNVNVPLLRKTLEHITDHPEEWDQTVWAKQTPCGTVACLAGTAVQIAGHELHALDHGAYFREECESIDTTLDGHHVSWVAQKELGLDDSQARTLFDEENCLSDLWNMAERFTEGEIRASEQDR